MEIDMLLVVTNYSVLFHNSSMAGLPHPLLPGWSPEEVMPDHVVGCARRNTTWWGWLLMLVDLMLWWYASHLQKEYNFVFFFTTLSQYFKVFNFILPYVCGPGHCCSMFN